MKVLVACEESQEICKAFRAKGHEAYSCDIQDCSGGHPEWHIQGDVLPLLNGNCTFSTMDGHTHTRRQMGYDYRTSTLYIFKQCSHKAIFFEVLHGREGHSQMGRKSKSRCFLHAIRLG